MRLVLLGDPVEHSLSPLIHAAALQACGIDGTYEARRVDAAGAHRAFAEVADGRLDGANVTMPHKRLAADFCDRLDRDARTAGAVNTVVRRDGGVEGWNTDVIALRSLLADMPADAPLLVLGGGGAAAAVVVAAGDREIRAAARTPGQIDLLQTRTGVAMSEVPWSTPVDGAIVVNATPLGMAGESLPDGIVDAGVGLLDLAYGPRPTPAAALAKGLGIPCEDGLGVLVEQAVHSFAIWTGVQPDRAVMRAALPGE